MHQERMYPGRVIATALRNPSAKPAAEPASCHGVPTATVSQFATQIIGGK